MKQKLSKNITYWLGVTAIGLIVGLSIQFVQAWTEPPVGTIPPANNVGAPINVSNTGQSKAGNLLLNSSGTWANGLIVANGRVGIGTTNPGAKLEIAGQIKITGGSPGAGKVLTSDASGLASWQMGVASGVSKIIAGTNITISPTSGIGNVTINSTGGSGLPSGTSGQTLRHDGANWVANSNIYNNGTNVGIGTMSPSSGSKLHVAGGHIHVDNNYGLGDTVGGYGIIPHLTSPDRLSLLTGWGERLVILANGNVGIGTASPGQKLDVQGGNIRTSNNLSTNNFSPTLPNGWNGIHTNDLHARWSIRTQNLCLGGGGGGDAVGDCRSAWPGEAKKGAAVYSCPSKWWYGYGHTCASSCSGHLSLQSTCSYATGDGCNGLETLSCTFAGYLVP